jgi:hypothetical protein
MIRYERVTFVEKPTHCPKRIILCISRETDLLLVGTEVGKDGDEIVRPKADITKHIISKDMLAKRESMRMNNTYGWLEVIR